MEGLQQTWRSRGLGLELSFGEIFRMGTEARNRERSRRNDCRKGSSTNSTGVAASMCVQPFHESTACTEHHIPDSIRNMTLLGT